MCPESLCQELYQKTHNEDYLRRLFSLHAALGLCVDGNLWNRDGEGKKEEGKKNEVPTENEEEETDEESLSSALFCSHLTPAKNREIIFLVDTRRTEKPMRTVLRAILRIMRHFFSLNRFTFSGAVYLPPAMDGRGGGGGGGRDEMSHLIFGRFIPRTLLGAEYFDFSASEIFVRTLIDLDPFKAVNEMRESFRVML